MTFDLAAQLQLVQELRHLILVQAKRFLHGFTAELHTAEREEIERELFQRLRRRFQRCRIKRAGTGLIVTVRAFAESTAENQRLHKEMESYEADGDMLKSALINAQRMGENVIREANQKSEEILHRANLRGDDIIRDANELLQKASDRADEIINEANEKKLAEEREYDRVRLEVTRFKSDVLNLYRSHVESLSRLPEFQKEEPAEDAPAEDEAAAAETTAAAVTEEIAEAQPAAADVDAEDETPADEKTSEEFWAQDESQLKLDPPPAPAAEDEAAAPDYAAFKGVKFSE